MRTVVLLTGGKRDDCYLVAVKIFNNTDSANEYCEDVNNGSVGEKYWNHAEIIDVDTFYELGIPDDEGFGKHNGNHKREDYGEQ